MEHLYSQDYQQKVDYVSQENAQLNELLMWFCILLYDWFRTTQPICLAHSPTFFYH